MQGQQFGAMAPPPPPPMGFAPMGGMPGGQPGYPPPQGGMAMGYPPPQMGGPPMGMYGGQPGMMMPPPGPPPAFMTGANAAPLQ